MSKQDFVLDVDNKLFSLVGKNCDFVWWKNLMADKDLYFDVRKHNKINVYHNGGSLMSLSMNAKEELVSEISIKYVLFQKKLSKDSRIHFTFTENDSPSFGDSIELLPLPIKDFSSDVLNLYKERLREYNLDESEKGIQAKYVTDSLKSYGVDPIDGSKGLFIDSEFAYEVDKDNEGRVDLVWLQPIDVSKGHYKLFFVELKRCTDSRLKKSSKKVGDKGYKEDIVKQLEKYKNSVTMYENELIEFYKKLMVIKNKLGIFDFEVKKLDLELKPILLIGDCTEEWLNDKAVSLHDWVKSEGCAYGGVYQNFNEYNFNVPKNDVDVCCSLF